MNFTPYTISVRDLAEFIHRRGNLGGERSFRRSNRAVEGIKGHQRIQKSRGPEYRPEVSVEAFFTQSEIQLKVIGRIDGLIEGLIPLLEEIKTVENRWSHEADPVHWAQLKIYAGILALQKEWTQFSLQLTYLELGTDQITLFREESSREEVMQFLNDTITEWFSWLISQEKWIQQRNDSIDSLSFPFTPFRKGQRELSIAAYRAIRDQHHLFVEAPTGMGKTLATLFPAIKAFPLLNEGKIFYATAKGSGRWAVMDALDHLRKSGLHLKSLSLVAKSKICFSDQPSGCDPSTCPFTQGYYDRVKPALRELLTFEKIDQETIQTLSKKHQVCPFELSLDATLWVDLVIGDYNYLFDPGVMLQRFFGEGKVKHVALVDEAHNLVDRSRDMYSATLQVEDLSIQDQNRAKKRPSKMERELAKARQVFVQLLKTQEEEIIPSKSYHRGARTVSLLSDELISILERTSEEIETNLLTELNREETALWLEPWFAINRFLKVSEVLDETYRIVTDPEGGRITLFCLDPSAHLAETLKGLRSVIFFSATLSPIDYFFEVLGGSLKDRKGIFPSPFGPEQMKLQIAPLDVSYQGRNDSLNAVTAVIKDHLAQMPGNHLIFCPSMIYLKQLYGKLTSLGIETIPQTPAMNEQDRELFLQRFITETPVIGLAVLAGIFAEGVDLPGNQLVGVTVVGVGLPGLSIERDLLMRYYDQKSKKGFDYAYRFPGVQRILQAVGRLIRTESDRGNVLLIDQRYLEQRYRRLLPKTWFDSNEEENR